MKLRSAARGEASVIQNEGAGFFFPYRSPITYGNKMRSPTNVEKQRGAAAVEFALVVPLLVTILFAVIYFSIYFNAKQGVQAAAREGARVASLRGSSAANACFQATGSLGGIAISNPFVQVESVAPTGTATTSSCSPTVSCPTSGANVYVRVSGEVPFSIPFWPDSPTSGFMNVSSTAVFRCE